MMEKPMNMGTEQPMPAPDQQQGQDDGSEPQGIDSIIAMVDGYIAKPETVTPETLMDLRAQLDDLKTVLEPQADDQGAQPGPGAGAPPRGGLASMIGGK